MAYPSHTFFLMISKLFLFLDTLKLFQDFSKGGRELAPKYTVPWVSPIWGIYVRCSEFLLCLIRVWTSVPPFISQVRLTKLLVILGQESLSFLPWSHPTLYKDSLKQRLEPASHNKVLITRLSCILRLVFFKFSFH